MGEYKRLTEKNERYGAIDVVNDLGEAVSSNCGEVTKKALERLAELEDKIEAGTAVELPCKIGDTVYIVGRKYRAGSYEGFINTGKFRYSDIEKFGDSVFLTREAAEARLKELEEGK